MIPSTSKTVAEFIQLAIAPIFLLMAVATTLTVFAGRLSRIVDRGRSLEARGTPDNAAHRDELRVLERRAQLIYRALSLGVSAAILVSLLMALAFAGEIFHFNTAAPVALLFMARSSPIPGPCSAFAGSVLAIGHSAWASALGLRPHLHMGLATLFVRPLSRHTIPDGQQRFFESQTPYTTT